MQPTLQGSCNALYGSCNEVFGDSSQLSTSIWSPKLLLSTNTIFWTIHISVENLLRSPWAVKLALGLFCDGRVALLVEFNVLHTLSEKKVFVMSTTSHMVLMPCKPSWHLAIAVHRGGFPGVGGCSAIFFSSVAGRLAVRTVTLVLWTFLMWLFKGGPGKPVWLHCSHWARRCPALFKDWLPRRLQGRPLRKITLDTELLIC